MTFTNSTFENMETMPAALKMPYERFDDAFMNHSYLSEWWLVEFLQKMKSTLPWSEHDETQLQEEMRHTRMFKAALAYREKPIVDDLSFSIQKGLYEKIGQFDFQSIKEPLQFNTMIYIIERRANYLYKMYLRFGQDDYYKQVVRAILKDEKGHLLHQKKQLKNSSYLDEYLQLDRRIFGGFLNNHYSASQSGSSIMTNLSYWTDLYEKKLVHH